MAKKLGRATVKAFSTEDASNLVGLILRDALKQSGPGIYQALTAGVTRAEMVERVANISGKAGNYAETYVDTGLSVIGRERIADTAKDLGLTWYRYIGGVIQTTREFCDERNGGYYHESEITSWADEDWDGKIEGTNEENIFSYCGGWNCRHDLIPVHESIVPEELLKKHGTNIAARTEVQSVALYNRAKIVGPELQAVTDNILAKNVNTTSTPLNYKSIESINRKALTELDGVVLGKNGVKDAVRNTLITDTENLKSVADDVRLSPVTVRFKVQDFSNTSGYRGYLSNSKLSDGTWAETQVNTPEMIFAKEVPANAKLIIGEAKWNEIRLKTGQEGGLGHKYYEEIRKLDTDDPEIAIWEQKSREYYSKFYYSYPKDWMKL